MTWGDSQGMSTPPNTHTNHHHLHPQPLSLFLSGMGMEVFATLAGATIQGQIVGVYHAKRAHDCSMLNHSDVLALNISSPYGLSTASPLTDTLHNTVSSM